MEKTYWTFQVALNDELIGQINFENEQAMKDFSANYEKLMERKDNKWGCAVMEWVDDGK